jgi:hypothetical protein
MFCSRRSLRRRDDAFAAALASDIFLPPRPQIALVLGRRDVEIRAARPVARAWFCDGTMQSRIDAESTRVRWAAARPGAGEGSTLLKAKISNEGPPQPLSDRPRRFPGPLQPPNALFGPWVSLTMSNQGARTHGSTSPLALPLNNPPEPESSTHRPPTRACALGHQGGRRRHHHHHQQASGGGSD